MDLDNGASRRPAKQRGMPARLLPWCFLLLLFACDTVTCGLNRERGGGRLKNMAAPWCFNDRITAGPAGFDDRTVDERSTGYRGAGLGPGDLDPCGSVEVLRPDTVIEGMDISGSIRVRARRVTVRNCRIRSSGRFPVRVFPGGSLAIEYTEIIGTPSCEAAVAPGNYMARRLDIHGTTDGLRAGSNVIIEQCYIHGLAPGGSRNCGIRQHSGRDLLVRNNTIVMPPGSASAIMLATDTGPIDNVLIDGNTASGGDVIIYSRTGHHVPPTAPTNVRISNNRLGRDSGLGTFSIDGKITFSGNVWLDNGRSVPQHFKTSHRQGVGL